MRGPNRGLFIGFIVMVICLGTGGVARAQSESGRTTTAAAPSAGAPAITAASTPMDLAHAAVAAMGGDKFKNLKSMVLVGSVDLYAPNSTQSIPGKFVIVTAGEKMMIDIDARPAVSFKQVYNGEQTYSSLPNVQLPPPSKYGPPMLTKLDQPGFKVTALPDKKKLRGFRVSDPDGNTTDFYLDPATGRISTFLIPFNGYTFGTENKKFKEIDGVVVPLSFVQRLEMPQGAFFADYTVKDVKLNQQIGDDVFAIPN